MGGDVDKPHIGHAAVVYEGLTPRGSGHGIPPEEGYPGPRVKTPQGGYDMRGMEVARRLAG